MTKLKKFGETLSKLKPEPVVDGHELCPRTISTCYV